MHKLVARPFARKGFTMAAVLLMALAVVALWSWPRPASAQDKPTVYGKKLVRVYELPLETLAKFARFKAQPGGGLLADTEDWAGEAIDAPSAGNPYTLVVKVSGTVLADGDVATRWLPGWGIDGVTRMGLMTGLTKPAAKAGERLELVGASAPVSFKEDRSVVPVAGFAGASNFQLDRVQVEVWSGVGKASFLQLVSAWTPLLGGLVFLGLFLWWRRG